MSIDSVVLPTTGFLNLSLDELCDVISQHRSLQAAEIVCTEGYAIRIGAIMHRLLLLQLRRPRKKMVWLRLDRLRSTKVSNFSFLLSGGSTPANDRVRKVPATRYDSPVDTTLGPARNGERTAHCRGPTGNPSNLHQPSNPWRLESHVSRNISGTSYI
ncbi:hypothetical protein DL93DRAFT_2083723 [Clavulina sp. PMI_390]|nr:hypothetical protein DL93DRAFT_2083723 [Clavulina sp. PMI_390]